MDKWIDKEKTPASSSVMMLIALLLKGSIKNKCDNICKSFLSPGHMACA